MKTLQPKLILSSLELEAFGIVLKASLEYYHDVLGVIENNENFLTRISEIHSKIIILRKLYNDILVNLQNPKYKYDYRLDLTHALQLLCSILPCDNKEFYLKVKNMVLAHCVDVLKFHDIINDNVCYNPPLPNLEPRPFHNLSTSIQDYFEN